MDRAIVESNAAERERLAELVARLSEDDYGRETEPGWTVGAALVHIAFWDRRVSVLIDRWTEQGAAPSPVDLDAINDALLPQWRLVPPRAAGEDLLAAMAEMDGKVAALPADLAADILTRELARLDRGNHRRAHREQIERALGM